MENDITRLKLDNLLNEEDYIATDEAYYKPLS